MIVVRPDENGRELDEGAAPGRISTSRPETRRLIATPPAVAAAGAPPPMSRHFY